MELSENWGDVDKYRFTIYYVKKRITVVSFQSIQEKCQTPTISKAKQIEYNKNILSTKKIMYTYENKRKT